MEQISAAELEGDFRKQYTAEDVEHHVSLFKQLDNPTSYILNPMYADAATLEQQLAATVIIVIDKLF